MILRIFNKSVNPGGKSVGSRFRRLRKFILAGGSKEVVLVGGGGSWKSFP